jgi:hypothetical protein
MVVQKSTHQVVNVPIPVKNVTPKLYGLSYPSARPLKIYRKQGTSNTVNSPVDCNCSTLFRVGIPFKMIGKNDDGVNKIPCCVNKGPNGSKTGNIIGFSGNASIRSASTRVASSYYSNYSSYLKKRGNTYAAKSVFHRIPEVDYELQPNDQIPDSSSFYENSIVDQPACKLTIYKPNNSTFSTEGSVESSTYVDRLKVNAITKNKASKTIYIFTYNGNGNISGTVPLYKN